MGRLGGVDAVDRVPVSKRLSKRRGKDIEVEGHYRRAPGL